MKYLVLVGLFLICFGLGLASVLGWRWWRTQYNHAPFVPQPQEVTLNPPRQSLTGTVASLSGEVVKDARNQDEPVTLTPGLSILEDEVLTTSSTGQTLIQFPPDLTIGILPEALATFSSTNPSHFLVKLDQGTIVITTDSLTSAVSVRSLHALLTLTQGQATIRTNAAQKTIVVSVTTGTVDIGYIDTNNRTQMVKLTQGQTALFDDAQRTLTVE